jgi:hypothetical protein
MKSNPSKKACPEYSVFKIYVLAATTLPREEKTYNKRANAIALRGND